MKRQFLRNNSKNICKSIYQVVVITAIMFLTFHALFKTEKIGYVDSAKILSDYKGSEAAKKEFQKKSHVWQQNIDTLTSEVKASIGTYEKSLATMSAKEQQLSKELIANKQSQLANYQKAVQQSANQENQKLTQAVVAQINAYLTEYGRKHRYSMILIANPSGTIAYGKEGTDITGDVLEGLNQQYKGSK